MSALPVQSGSLRTSPAGPMVAGGTARLTAPPAPPVQRSSRSNPVLNRLRKDSITGNSKLFLATSGGPGLQRSIYKSRQGTGCSRSSKRQKKGDAKVFVPDLYWATFRVDKVYAKLSVFCEFWLGENIAHKEAFRSSKSGRSIYHYGNFPPISCGTRPFWLFGKGDMWPER